MADGGPTGQQAVLWPASAPGTVKVLDVGAEYSSASPEDIDDQGRVLVWAYTTGRTDGKVWSPDGTSVKLPTPHTQRQRPAHRVAQRPRGGSDLRQRRG
ncbi:hypothetical protein JOF56_011563 [Kibdelosporangium banguiense]|uniref:Uncharacterized protein n=1 Tax=Kibdelosporangium banguiense TaxID=1365924 RepID=A0ABS4U4P7_9PSEU|nr:hypothetical protein [Kibdelosporangium banguiense]MBP2331178.1 hypothetical protein [Kibdelosporangium banguiense]